MKAANTSKKEALLRNEPSGNRYVMNTVRKEFCHEKVTFTVKTRFYSAALFEGKKIFTLQLFDKSHRHPGSLGVENHLALRCTQKLCFTANDQKIRAIIRA